jgi:hypothetical protein
MAIATYTKPLATIWWVLLKNSLDEDVSNLKVGVYDSILDAKEALLAADAI